MPHAGLSERSKREFCDVRHPMHPEFRVERVVVCPSGIHVVTSLAPTPGGTDAERAPASMVSASHTAADLVSAVLPPRYRDRVRPVLCRLDEAPMAELVGDVLVTSPSTLEHVVGSAPVVLSTSEVNDVALRLDARLEPFPLPSPPKRRRWRRRHTLVAALLAASAGTAATILGQDVGSLPLPW